ncbi:MAG TPA: sigma-70 family RNA polymerase sigma factor [Bryobacteraceae bacterium]|nr:sigma-70 family RNA polymerase sigma factor [Bryobacteraceae bacterium]
MVLHEESDAPIIEACRQGDPHAFASLFEAHRDKVYSIALRFTGDPAAALDIAQDVFVKLLTRIRDYHGGARFETWLYRVTVNACLDRQKRRRPLPFIGEALDAILPARETTLAGLLRQEAQDHVRQAVAKLSPEHRMVIVLRYTQDLSYEEIAEVMACSRGTVASRLNRAHKILERRLKRFRYAQA